jgi:divalent metal cation (Fe/Co/Zn/Cd) transporter
MRRAIRNLIRLVSAGLIVFGGMEIGLELVRRRMRQTEISLNQCLIGCALIAAGGILLGFSGRLAAALVEDDEDDNPPDITIPPSEV